MARKWTDHKLSEPMLKRLARMAAGHPSGAGTTMMALVDRDMAIELFAGVYPDSYAITDWGRRALNDARADGWYHLFFNPSGENYATDNPIN